MTKLKLKNIIKEMITEASFETFTINKILTDRYVKNYINDLAKTGSLDHHIEWYMEINGLEDEDPDTIKKTPEFFDFIKDTLYDTLNTAMMDIFDVIEWKSGLITIYRAMSVPDDWVEHLKKEGNRLGIYWSWEEDGAVPYWGGDTDYKNTAILKTQIKQEYVDWQTTLELSMNQLEEAEIRLFKNTPIKLQSISINGDEVDLTELGLKNKVFRA